MHTDHDTAPSPASAGRPKVVALTGGIGAGKSSAGDVFRQLGVPCLDLDQVARRIHQDAGHPAMAAVAAALPAAMAADGTLQRGSLRSLFAIDPGADGELKRLLAPYVIADAERWARAQGAAYLIWESALIGHASVDCDHVLVIDAADDIRLARMRARNPDWSDADIHNILAMQGSRAAYIDRADVVIRNEGSRAALETAIRSLHQRYLTTWSPQP